MSVRGHWGRLLGGLGVSVALLVPVSAEAATFSYCDFSNVSTLTRNGVATQTGNVLRLTPNVGNQVASVYRTVPVPWAATTSFHSYFRFQILPNAAGADGISFILQNVGLAAIGAPGGGIGYGGILKSVEVEFDTYLNAPTDPNANHVGVMLNGANTVHLATGTPAFTMANGGTLFAWVDYDAPTTTLRAYLAKSANKPAVAVVTSVVNVALAVGAQAYVGFTGSTGGLTNEHDLFEWEFSTDGLPCTCEGNAFCSGSSPICDATGTCRGCTGDADCSGGLHCAPAGDPLAGQCVACASNANCDANVNTPTPICNKVGGSVDTCRACATSAECTSPLASVCEIVAPHLGQCVTCATNADCAGSAVGPVCFDNGTSNVCVQCTTNANCSGTTPVCNGGTHQCQACASDANCAGATPACETMGALAGACGQCSSTNTSQCTGLTPACNVTTGTCVGCNTNANCAGAAPICNVSTHMCRPCTANPDCAGMAGAPVCATSGGRQGQCVACLANTDCAAPTAICDTATDTCVGCTTNADCSGRAPVCSATTHTCMPCANDTSCAAPTPACQTAGPLGGACTRCSATNGSQCQAGSSQPVCVLAVGTCGCTMTSNCGNNQVCDPAQLPAGKCLQVGGPDGGMNDGGAVNDASGDGSDVDGGGLPDSGDTDASVREAGVPPEGGAQDGALGGPGSLDAGSLGDVAGGGCSCRLTASRGPGPGGGASNPGEIAFALGVALCAACVARRRRQTGQGSCPSKGEGL